MVYATDEKIDLLFKLHEKSMENIDKLRKSQEKTDSQIKELRKSTKELKESMKDLRKSQEETDSQIKELRESTKELKESMKDLRKSQEETDSQIKELRESTKELKESMKDLKKSQEKTEKGMRDLQALRRDLGISQGDVAEDSIRRSVEGDLYKYDIDIHEILLNKIIKDEKTKKKLAEYDIVAINDTEVVVIEVKNKINKNQVDKFIEKQIPKFKEYLPEYKNYKLYAGMGGLVVKPEMEKYVESKGLFLFTQNGDSFEINNNVGFKPKVFG